MAYVNLLQVVYPIGAIYQSVSATSPASIIGGTWSAIQNRFLVGAGGSYTVNSTGGETSHKLTVNEMPSHTHNNPCAVINGGNAGQYRSLFATNSDFWNKNDSNNATASTGGGHHTTICHPTTEFTSGEEPPSIRGDVSWLTSISYKLSILSVLIISQLQQLVQHLLWAARGIKSTVEDSYVRLVIIIQSVPQAAQKMSHYLLTNFPLTSTKFKRILLVMGLGNSSECGLQMLAQVQLGQFPQVVVTLHRVQESLQQKSAVISHTKTVRHILSHISGDAQPNILVGGVA